MKPTIRDYDDVERAFDRLVTFVENLREQVLNVRQTTEKEKADVVLAKLLFQIKEARGTARSWRNSYEGKIPFPDEDERKRGEYMLNLYKTNFEGATEKSKRKRGGHGLARPAPLTEFLDDALKLLYADASYLAEQDKSHRAMGQEMAIADPVFREFDFHGMKIIVADPKHHGLRIRAYIEYVEMAYKDLVRKGFKDVWYGTFFLMSDKYEKFSSDEKAAYANAGYKDMESRAGSYHSGSDIVRISVPPTEEVVHVIAHEMGHRYWFKIMSQAQRVRFESLIEGDWSMLHALLLNQEKLDDRNRTLQIDALGTTYHTELACVDTLYRNVEEGRDLSVRDKKFIRERFRKLGLRVGVPLVSEYSHARPTEAFAEVFERYVTERDMTRDQVESFRSVLVRGKGGGGSKIGAKRPGLVRRRSRASARP